MERSLREEDLRASDHLIFLGATLAMSQPVPGKKFEFSTAFSFSSFKFSGGMDSESLLLIPLRFGYFVWKGLEIEPELTLAKFSPGDARSLQPRRLPANRAARFRRRQFRINEDRDPVRG
jgi:hypothetical protein